MAKEKNRRGPYKQKFIESFDNAIVDPGTIRRWKRLAVEGI